MDVKQRLARSLSADNPEILPFIPYLMQDIGVLGGIPADVAALVKKHSLGVPGAKALDLACGKGTVAIHLARYFPLDIRGIDLFEPFIKDAREKAEKMTLEGRVRFEAADLFEIVEREKTYALVILNGATEIFDDLDNLFAAVKKTVEEGGHLIMDDGFAVDDSVPYYRREDFEKALQNHGFKWLDFKPVDSDIVKAITERNLAFLRKRTDELKKSYPDKAALFERYLDRQEGQIALYESGAVKKGTFLIRYDSD